MEKVKPGEFTKIFNEAHIILKPSNRCDGRTPNIGVNKLKWRSRHMFGNPIRELMALSKLT
jgi:hypothetical protein